LNITADRMDAFQRENRVVFEGNVVVQQDDTFIYAKRITADMAPQDAGGGIRKVVAQQDVRITQNDRVATCERAEFDHLSRTIELLGSPKIWQGKDWIDGQKVVVRLDQEKMTVVGSEEKRVSAVLYPKSRKEEGEKPAASEAGKAKRPSLTAPFAPESAAASSEGQGPLAPAPSPAAVQPPSSRPPEKARPATAVGSMPAFSEPSDRPPAAASAAQAASEPVGPAKASPVRAEEEAARIAEAALARGRPSTGPAGTESKASARKEAAAQPAASAPQETIEGFLERWRRAWESKDLESYMACYSPRFRSGRWDWRGWRDHKAEINRRYQQIEVRADGIQVTQGADGAKVSFVQRYRADKYEDKGRKELEIVQEGGSWKILREVWSKL
jgi:lipopolysaccharide export system protein LptA